MKYVTCFGQIWSLRERQYKRLIEFIGSGGVDINLHDYGTQVGSIDLNVSDIDEGTVYNCRVQMPGTKEHAELQAAKQKLGM